MIKTFVVNMEKDVEKRREIESQLSRQENLDVEFVRAVEGKKLSECEIQRVADFDAFKSRYRDFATLPALGCSLSHCYIYDKIISENINWALIIEDDAKLSPSIATKIFSIIDSLNDDEGVAVLLTPEFSYYSSNQVEPRKFEDFAVYPVCEGLMTSGYIINKKGAEIIRKCQTPTSYIADSWWVFKSAGLKLYGSVPHIISYKDGFGEIGQSQQTALKKNIYRTIRSIGGRILARYNDYSLSRKRIFRSKKLW